MWARAPTTLSFADFRPILAGFFLVYHTPAFVLIVDTRKARALLHVGVAGVHMSLSMKAPSATFAAANAPATGLLRPSLCTGRLRKPFLGRQEAPEGGAGSSSARARLSVAASASPPQTQVRGLCALEEAPQLEPLPYGLKAAHASCPPAHRHLGAPAERRRRRSRRRRPGMRPRRRCCG